MYTSLYNSPFGKIMLAADDKGLVGLWFVGQKYFALGLDKKNEEKETEIIKLAKKWLDVYFDGKEPDFKVPLHFIGTDFQNDVWNILYNVPYGKTITYGEIGNIIAQKRGLKTMSAQAIGGAVGKNKISIIVPCHRVVGKNGSLTGYAGGLDKKINLLKLEESYQDNFYVPNKIIKDLIKNSE